MLTKLRFVETTEGYKYRLYTEEVWHIVDQKARAQVQLWVSGGAQHHVWAGVEHVGNITFQLLIAQLEQEAGI